MKTKRVAGAACVLACTLAGCTPGRVLDQFSDPEPHSVTLACGEAYKIYEKERPRRLVIASSVKQEFTRDTCEGFEKLDKHERFAKIAKGSPRRHGPGKMQGRQRRSAFAERICGPLSLPQARRGG